MKEYFEKEALMTHLEERREYLFKENGDYDHYTNGFDEAVDKVENFPTIEAEPVRRGRWVDRYGGRYANPLYVCSECKGKALYNCVVDERGKALVVQVLSAACPHCRAKMDVTDINVGNKDGGADNG